MILLIMTKEQSLKVQLNLTVLFPLDIITEIFLQRLELMESGQYSLLVIQ